MTVRTCTEGAKPGYQAMTPEGIAGICHTYNPDDRGQQQAAMRAAARDAEAQIASETQLPPAL